MGRPAIYTSSRLSQWLQQKGKSRAQFAEELGCSAWRVSAICKGESPGPDLARKIVALTAGAVTFDDLFAQSAGDAA